MMNSSIPIQFKLSSYQPGSRGYNNGIFEPVSDFLVSVEVPLETKYIANAEKILVDLVGGEIDDPVLTVKGWAYVEDAFLDRAIVTKEEALSNEKIEWEGEE